MEKFKSMKCVALMMDSEVSFEDVADEEIDTTVIEEEDWIEYITRSTEDAIKKMERAKIRCWNRTHHRVKDG